MANLQATLRSNMDKMLPSGTGSSGKAGERKSVAGVVRMINRQIYNYTAANKFATFFYAVYDEQAQTLTYCNAGHNPPLYFSGNDVRGLTVGGTVVGIFPDADYEQEEIALRPGDILLAYTDGIVESVNEYGEEFGEQRLISLVQQNKNLTGKELQEAIVRQVSSWSFEKERDDDMTLIIAKIR
jgi:phosphoserine phosphatase RsbU/P